MSLTEDLNNLRNHAVSQLSPETLAIIEKAIQQVANSGITEQALKIGDHVPNFTLPNAVGKSVELQQLLTQSSVVISFYRGVWCPYCNLELRALQQVLPELTALGASLVAISPQTPDNSLSTVEKHSLTFEVLSDVGNQVAKQFSLVYTVPTAMHPVIKSFGIDLPAYNGDDSFELPLTATYIINTDGTIGFSYVNPDYTQRLDPADIIAALSQLQAKAGV
ncbi:peroxiredoxin-like family protein [Fischerella sp. PCC 9605]|uniref:peroxiredoxin-like family protein n=1 Tax=Fischerella sp. PCC 9605 TaxID=1173024 RepID=UPI0004791448|nr:peroxiredoxin-like family protein [Fischerella sp. PCC 9605]